MSFLKSLNSKNKEKASTKELNQHTIEELQSQKSKKKKRLMFCVDSNIGNRMIDNDGNSQNLDAEDLKKKKTVLVYQDKSNYK